MAILVNYDGQAIIKQNMALDMVKVYGIEQLIEIKATGNKNADHINIGKMEEN